MKLPIARAAKPRLRFGGRILADALVAQGVDHVFAVPGESYLDVLDGLYDVRDKIKLVTCRFEAGAGNMAEAYGKLTGKPGVVMVTRGPGAAHAAISIHIAQQDSTPMVVIVGQIPSDERDRESFQEVDYRRFFGPIAKWVTEIDDARRIPELVAHAFDVATSGRPGPVVISITEEMQKQQVQVPDIGPADVSVAHPDPAALERMMKLLGKAEKPLVILGGSRWSDEGRANIAKFLRANKLPVAVGFRRQDTYDGTHETYVGDLGVGSDPALVAKAKEADLILAIGTRLGEAVTQGYTLLDLAGSTPVIHVYPVQEEIGRVFRPALGITSELNVFAEAAAALRPVSRRRWLEWTKELRAIREKSYTVPKYSGALNTAQIFRDLEKLLPDDAIVTSDAGNFAGWLSRFMHIRQNQRFIGPTNGGMGYGAPSAVGAKIAFPDRMVVGVAGDGGFLMTAQDIATALHHGVAPIFCVFNNQMYGTIRMYQERTYPRRISGTALTNPDFAKYAESFGGHGEVVTKTEDFIPAFKRAVASGKPAVIEIRQDPDQITSRTTIADLRGGKPKPRAAAKKVVVKSSAVRARPRVLKVKVKAKPKPKAKS